MKRTFATVLALSSIAAVVPLSRGALDAAELDSAPVHQERNGQVVVEVESRPVTGGWQSRSAVGGFTGSSYYVWEGGQQREGGSGALTYRVNITDPGKYQLLWRSRITQGTSSTEANDSFVSMSGAPIAGEFAIGTNQWTKAYQNQLNMWSWNTATKDRDPRPIRQFFSAGEHTIRISGRSPGHGIDRFVLFKYEDKPYENAFRPASSSQAAMLTSLAPSPTSAGSGTTTTSTMPMTTTSTMPMTTSTTMAPGSPASSTSLMVSSSPVRSGARALSGATVSGDAFVFVSPDGAASRVRFFVDDPDASGSPVRTEWVAPYDLAGGSASTARPFDTTMLSNGAHSVTAVVDLVGGGAQMVTASFTVANGSTTTSTTMPTTTTTTTVHTSMDPTAPTSTKQVIVPDDPGIDYVTPDKVAAANPWEIGWAVGCLYSHSAKDDPIVFPGQPGRSHLHDFFGNTVTDAFTDAQDLRAGSSLCTTVDDMSGYWVPALYVNGVAKEPHSMTFYYEAGVADRSSIVPMPYGLEMIAGNARATGPQDPYIFRFEEKGNVKNNTSDGQMIRAESGKIFARITFPDCWDGKRLSSSDQSHVAYHTKGNTCPASHPVAIPRLRMFITYDTNGAGVSLESGPWYTMHADFFNAWTPATQKRLVEECIVPSVRCNRVFDVEQRWIPKSTTMMMAN